MSNSLTAAVITALTNRGVTTQSGKSTPIIETLTGVAKAPITNIVQSKTMPDITVEKPAYVRVFNKIVLTLENSLIPEDKLEKTPSFTDGLDPETEKDLRILGCELIQTAGILLKLPQVAMATGQVLFQRFFYSKSFVRHNMETVAMSCLCLASKIEEAPRRIRDVMNVFHHIKQVRGQKEISPMIVDQYYTNLKTQVIKAERRVLKELGFCVHVKHPHKLIVMYLQVLKYEGNEKLMQMSWNFMNDSLRTDVFMRHQPETIACACIYLSARKLGIVLPKNPPWFSVFRVTEDDIISICYRVMELYIREKVNVEKLEQAVDELKKRYAETRNKLKEANTITATTTVDRNNGSHNAWGGFIQRAVPLPLTTDKPPERNSRSRSRSLHSHNSRSQSGTPRQRSHSRSRSPRVRSHTNSRSNSRSVSAESINYKKSKKSSGYAERKRKSRHYSRSPSSSPYEKQRKSKSSRVRDRERDRERESNSYGVSSSRGEVRVCSSTTDKYRDRDRERERERERHERERDRDGSRPNHRTSSSSKHYAHSHHHRSGYNHGSHYNSSSGGRGGNSRSSNNNNKHYDTERSRDRKR